MHLGQRKWLWIVFGLALAPLTGIAPGAAQEGDPPTVLITGSNRGIGFEFAKQYAEKGWQVIATCRTPGKADALQALASAHDNVTIEELDITDAEEIAALDAEYANRPIDLLLNNAGLIGPRPGQKFGFFDYDLFEETYRINAMGTMRVTEAFLDVEASAQKKVVTLGSAAGSLQMIFASPDYYPYRASKAALHIMMRILANNLRDSDVIVTLVNPGIVDTQGLLDLAPEDIPEDFADTMQAVEMGIVTMQRPPESVAGLVSVIDGLTKKQSGEFLSYDGSTVPW
jgi:NAD(P)-dependent dehydrogenase (short-subunit alcohol dehydrogenase family)